MYEYDAKVINVVDGDTVDCVISLGFYLTAAHRLRLLGVNCPEVHGETKAAGLKAAEYTRATLLGQTVRIRTAKSDSFGRWLCQVYLDGRDFNQSLVDRGLAVPYMVGKVAGPGTAIGEEQVDAGRQSVDVYSRPECVFNYCPYTIVCQSEDTCLHPAARREEASP
jgi:micrococcal nuclease